MIHVVRTPAPPIFQTSEWQREQKCAAEFYSKVTPDRRQHHFVFKFHKHSEVRQALEELFHGNCAFCEIRKEKALLMDPCVDHPEYDWIFNANGVVASNSLRGAKTKLALIGL